MTTSEQAKAENPNVTLSKGEMRKLRKARKASGESWNGTRTPAQERKHERRMYRWARRYDALNGAPEGDWDR